MSTPPYMKWFWGDYHQDTRHLSRSEHGAYFLLIGEAWNRGGYLPDDDAMLARWAIATPSEWAELKPIVMAFFRLVGGRWKHKRVCEEIDALTTASRKRKLAGKMGGIAKALKENDNPPSNATAMPPYARAFPDTDSDTEISSEPKGSSHLSDAPEKRPPKPMRGTRLPEGWEPSDEDTAYAARCGLTTGEINRAADDFRDYWRAKAGRDASKCDWAATWRGWVRRSADRKGANGGAGVASRSVAGTGGSGVADFASIIARRRGYA